LLPAYSLATQSSSSGAQGNFLVVDGAAPLPLRLSTAAANFVAPPAMSAHASGGWQQELAPLAYFVAEGQVFQVNLSASGATAPQRISSLSTACQVLRAVPRDVTSTDSWIGVTTAGADANCNTLADNAEAWVRTGDADTQAPIVLPAGVEMPLTLTPLYDPNGSLLYLLAIDRRTSAGDLMLYSRDFVAGAPTVTTVRTLSGDPSQATAAYLSLGGTVRRLTWTSAGAELSAALHTYAGTPSNWATTDTSGAFFGDGARVYRLNGAVAATLVAEFASGPVQRLYTTPTRVVVQHGPSLTTELVSSVDKAGGPILQLATAAMLGRAKLEGTRGETVVYTEGAAAQPQVLNEIQADGMLARQISPRAILVAPQWARLRSVGSVWDPITPVGALQMEGLVFCSVPVGDADCRDSSVSRYRLSDGQLASAGAFVSGAVTSFTAVGGGALYAGLPGVINALASGSIGAQPWIWVDAYLFTDDGGTAALTRLTQLVP